MNKDRRIGRKLVALALGIIGMLVLGSATWVQCSRARDLEHRADERRLRAKRAIDEAIRDAVRIKATPEEVRQGIRIGD